MLEQARIDGLGFPKQSDGALQVNRVPHGDGGDHKVQTARAIQLILAGNGNGVADSAEAGSLSPAKQPRPGQAAGHRSANGSRFASSKRRSQAFPSLFKGLTKASSLYSVAFRYTLGRAQRDRDYQTQGLAAAA